MSKLARFQCAVVYLSITTLDPSLSRVLEPRASLPDKRLEAIQRLNDAGIPTGVLVAPVIPGLTDHELPAIVHHAVEAGAGFAGYIILRLPHGVKELFGDWLDRHFPDKKDKVLNRIRAIRGGQLNDTRFSKRMKGEGIFAEQIASMFSLACRKAGIAESRPELVINNFQPSTGHQFALF